MSCIFLIESGWYKKSEITLDKIGDLYDADDEFFADGMLTITRTNIDNKYCRIALTIMTGFVRENKILLDGEFNRDSEAPSNLTAIKDKLTTYVKNSSGKNSMASHWQHNEQWLRDLRHDHLRFKNGRRYRRIYEG